MNRPLSVIVTSMAAALTACGFAYGADLTLTGLQTRANNVAGARLQLDRSLRWRERRRRMG